jgi:hypothetical protein
MSVIPRSNSDLFQRASFSGFPQPRLFLLFLAALLSGCHTEQPEPEFGAPYEIIINEISSAPDTPPRIAGDWLRVTLSYAGGCTDHAFELDSYPQRDTAYVWLVHVDNDDTCESLIYDDLNIRLPSSIRDANIIAMYDPEGGAPYILKWRQ